jgi:hypothetical protein
MASKVKANPTFVSLLNARSDAPKTPQADARINSVGLVPKSITLSKTIISAAKKMQRKNNTTAVLIRAVDDWSIG